MAVICMSRNKTFLLAPTQSAPVILALRGSSGHQSQPPSVASRGIDNRGLWLRLLVSLYGILLANSSISAQGWMSSLGRDKDLERACGVGQFANLLQISFCGR